MNGRFAILRCVVKEDTGQMDRGQVDFFISHAGADRAWAEWVAWQLIDAGYTVELDVWDWVAGRNFVTAMSDALERADRVVALFSAAYFDRSRYTTEEWTSAVLHMPDPEQCRLVPVRVEDVPADRAPAVLRPLVFRDVFGVGEEQARRVLLEALTGPRRPGEKPVFPGVRALSRLGGAGPRRPGTVPRIWNVPARNPGFTGRDQMLVAVRETLLSGDRAVVQALHGMGGVGKTQLAIEYAYRFAGAYDMAWWVNAEQGGLIGEQFAALGSALGCIPAGAGIEAVRFAVLAELRERGRWLLVFDNAEDPADIAGWLPGGGGHVLVSARARGWTEVAAAVEVDVLARLECVAILQARVTRLDAADADRLAAELGDLPLAVAQAAGFMAETGMPAAEYLGLLRTCAGQLLALAVPIRGRWPPPRRSRPPSLPRRTRLRQSWPICARSWRLSRSPKTCSREQSASCPETWRSGLRTRWPGGRPWPACPAGRWPASITAGCRCTASPRSSSATSSPRSRPPPPVNRSRRYWPPATPGTRRIIPHPGPGGPN